MGSYPPIEHLERAMQRRRQTVPKNLRPFTEAKRNMPRACLLIGQRGVGKTTFLFHHAREKRLLYLSADNPLLADQPLYETVNGVFMQGYSGVIIDEVHFARDWSLHLKALYDDFPEHIIWASDSSSMVLRSGVADLSRRFVTIQMPLLSFREFIKLKTGVEQPTFNPFFNESMEVSPEFLALFRVYRKIGTRPFFREGSFAERMMGILKKVLYSDVPFFLPRVTDGNLRLMSAIVGTLAKSPVPRLQVRSLCADWHIGAEKLYQLLFVMESVGLIRIIRKTNETKANTVGDKLFFGDPVYYDILQGNVGTAREALVAAMIAEAGNVIEAHGDETSGDFVIDIAGTQITVEVGDKKKKSKKADFVVRDDTDVSSGRTIPLWSLGFLY